MRLKYGGSAWRDEPPTDAQDKLVDGMFRLLGIARPLHTLGACSDFIGEHMAEYKAAMKQVRDTVLENAADAGVLP